MSKKTAPGCGTLILGAIALLFLIGKYGGNSTDSSQTPQPASVQVTKTPCPPGGMEPIEDFKRSGFIMQISPDGYDVYVSRQWYTSTLEEKKLIAIAFQRCISPGLHVNIYDGYSGKKLARFGEAWGFSIEE